MHVMYDNESETIENRSKTKGEIGHFRVALNLIVKASLSAKFYYENKFSFICKQN